VTFANLGPLGASCTFRYLLDLWVPLGHLGPSWTFRYLFALAIAWAELSNSAKLFLAFLSSCFGWVESSVLPKPKVGHGLDCFALYCTVKWALVLY
jgi:hypothetical protein